MITEIQPDKTFTGTEISNPQRTHDAWGGSWGFAWGISWGHLAASIYTEIQPSKTFTGVEITGA